MKITAHAILSASLVVLCRSLAAAGQVGDPQLQTDHPYYPGEFRMSTPARVADFVLTAPRGTLGNTTNRDKMIRLFLWRAEHYGHLYSPAVYNLPGVQPNPQADNPLMTDYDGMRGLFSYGFGLCGTNHAQMRPFVEAMGWTDRRRALNGDTGYEVYVDEGWRYFNTDQYTLHFLSESSTAHFASLDQVITTNHRYIEWNPDVGLGHPLPQANTHGGYQDFVGVTRTVPNRSLQWRDYYLNVWNTSPSASYKMYGEGYAATPIVYRLRKGESFTRWLHPDGIVTDLGLPGRVWWGYNSSPTGPYVEWSFVQNAPARDEDPATPGEESRGEQRYGNGCFDWQPDLAAGELLEGAAEVNGTLTAGGSPALRSAGSSKLVVAHFTPYTIAARPSDGKDPALGGATQGVVLTASAVGTVDVEISVNGGATWTSIGTLSSTTSTLDFTDRVKGRNDYLLRLSFDDGEGLNSFRLRTITMMNQGVYPNLKSGTSQVIYHAGNAGAMDLSPDLWSADSAESTTGYVRKVADSGNLTPLYYGNGSTYAYESSNNQPISITYRIDLPPVLVSAGAALKTIYAAGCYRVRIPPDGNPYGRIEIAPNLSGPWTQIAYYAPPSDNELSAYWTYGNSGSTPLGTSTYYVRFTTYNGGYTAGIRFLRLYATYSLPAPSTPIEVEYHWNNGSDQSHLHTVAAGLTSDTWTITTGTVAAQKKVILRVPSGGAGVPPTITTQPAHRTVTEGQTATFTVVASGTVPLSYQWKKNGVNIPGANGASYTTPPTTLADSGSQFTVVVTNAFGTVTSNPATLTVTAAGGTPVTVLLREGTNGYSGTLDTYLDQFNPDETYGSVERLEIRYYDDGSGLSEHMQTLLRFDLSSIPAGATVTSATLTVYNLRASSNGPGDVITLGKVTQSWTENHTWNMGVPTWVPSGVTLPSVAGYTLNPSPPEPYIIMGLASLVQDWINNPASNHGMIFVTANNLNFRLASSEYPQVDYRPALQVTYTTGGSPPPPTDTDGDGMSDSFENTWGFNPTNADQDGNGTLDGLDDWDGDGIPNQSDPTPGTPPVPPPPPPPGPVPLGGSDDGDDHGCGLMGLEVLALLSLWAGCRWRR